MTWTYFRFLNSREYGTRAPQVSKVDFRSPRALRAESRSAPNHSIVVQRTGMTPVGKAFRNEQGSVEDVFWDFQMNILGEKDDTPVHFCDTCELPIKIYGPGLPWWRNGWESACQCGGRGLEPWSGRIPHAAERLGPWATIAGPARLEPVLGNERPRWWGARTPRWRVAPTPQWRVAPACRN